MRISDWSSDVCSSDLVGKVGKTPHLAWRLKMKSDGNARFLTSGRGGTGRRAGVRFQYRKMWGFESLRPPPTAANAVGRPAARRVGNVCVRTCRYRWATYH